MSHQGPTVGYRIEEDGRSLAYLPDHEPVIGVELSSLGPDWLSGFSLIEGVDVLFHDAQYFDDEYESHIGWGHSATSHAVTMGQRARVASSCSSTTTRRTATRISSASSP